MPVEGDSCQVQGQNLQSVQNPRVLAPGKWNQPITVPPATQKPPGLGKRLPPRLPSRPGCRKLPSSLLPQPPRRWGDRCGPLILKCF